jgi:hypothetical protein
VILYGSAAAGDHAGRESDYNVLMVFPELDDHGWAALQHGLRRWLRSGQPAPWVFVGEELARSRDVFPIELSDVREAHTVLYGEDVAAGIEVQPEHLRLQLEREARAMVLRLRAARLQCRWAREVRAFMVRTIGAVGALVRAALRLRGQPTPAAKLDALELWTRLTGQPMHAVRRVMELKLGRVRVGRGELFELLAAYQSEVEALAAALDRWVGELTPRAS